MPETSSLSPLEQVLTRVKPRRRVRGIAAALLPVDAHGALAEEAFVAHLRRTHAAGLGCAVNMDTGYVNLLTSEEKARVLALAREALGPGVPFVAGAYIEREEGDPVSLYRREVEAILACGGTPILFQTARLHGRPARETVETYRQAVDGAPEALAFELGPVFAPNGVIWDEETVRGIMGIPAFTGMKHSSLDRLTELDRLALRDRERPDFTIYTGNDLGIDMIEYGSDYLLGLATFHPEAFAARDRAWEAGDTAYFALHDALQDLGNVAFRPPVPAYKHSAAVFLRERGLIPTGRTHPQAPERPAWEAELMRSCLKRIEACLAGDKTG